MGCPNPAKFGRIDPKDWREYDEIYTRPIWPAKLPHSPADYGDSTFHGRTHPDVIWVAMERYTKPGDVVWDCMAGGGTTVDVCEALDNTCIATDLIPARSDIQQADALTWSPSMMVDMVICHPPYLDIVEWEHPGTLAIGDVSIWNDMMGRVLDNVSQSLKMWHVLVLIVGQVYTGQQTIMLDAELLPYIKRNYRVLGRVIRPFGETKGGATAGAQNENLWRFRRLKYGIWGLGIDTVLFLQRTC